MVKNRKCYTCHTQYSYCPDCSKADALKPRWHSQFCSENCMTLWKALVKFKLGKLTKSEAKSIVSSLDLQSIESYAPCVQRDLSIILTEDKKPNRGRRTKAESIDEVSNIDLASNETTIHEVVKQENE